MIQQAAINQTMLRMLEEYTGLVVVPSNTTKKMPAYPFISYTIINTSTKKGTYSVATEIENVDGEEVQTNTRYMPLLQKWSFTIQSDNDAEAQHFALLCKDFFECAKYQELADCDIIVADVGDITPRDNMLTIEYEYRKGFDVSIRLNNVTVDTENVTIETVTINDMTLEKE